MPVSHQSKFFTGQMPFLMPNQQRQSTEGKSTLFINKSYRYITLAYVYVSVAVLGHELSSASCQLTDECRRHSWQSLSVFRFTREQATCRSSATAVAVPRTITHRYEFVIKCCVLV